MCSIIGVGERLHKVLGQIDFAHWTQVSDRCPWATCFLYEKRKKGWTVFTESHGLTIFHSQKLEYLFEPDRKHIITIFFSKMVVTYMHYVDFGICRVCCILYLMTKET